MVAQQGENGADADGDALDRLRLFDFALHPPVQRTHQGEHLHETGREGIRGEWRVLIGHVDDYDTQVVKHGKS
ncbi:hypothetical protein GCM10010524_26580 [Streptomyces mexicanus]